MCIPSDLLTYDEEGSLIGALASFKVREGYNPSPYYYIAVMEPIRGLMLNHDNPNVVNIKKLIYRSTRRVYNLKLGCVDILYELDLNQAVKDFGLTIK
jgi:hypothetical protein